MVSRAEDYRWSSALAHCTGVDELGSIDMDWWQAQGEARSWSEMLNRERADVQELEACTYSGKPFGEAGFVEEISEPYGRHWTRGRPPKDRAVEGNGAQNGSDVQGRLFAM